MAGTAHAVPITYTISGSGSGSLNGVAFDDDLVTFAFSTDTSDTMLFPPGSLDPELLVHFYINSAGVTTVTVNGVTDTFAPNSGFFGSTFLGFFPLGDPSDGAAAGFFLIAGNQDVGVASGEDPFFATYDPSNETGPVGPITVPGHATTITELDLESDGVYAMVSGGTFFWTGSPTSFTFAATPTPVPEPSSLTLTGLGLLLAVGSVVRSRKAGGAAA